MMRQGQRILVVRATSPQPRPAAREVWLSDEPGFAHDIDGLSERGLEERFRSHRRWT